MPNAPGAATTNARGARVTGHDGRRALAPGLPPEAREEIDERGGQEQRRARADDLEQRGPHAARRHEPVGRNGAWRDDERAREREQSECEHQAIGAQRPHRSRDEDERRGEQRCEQRARALVLARGDGGERDGEHAAVAFDVDAGCRSGDRGRVPSCRGDRPARGRPCSRARPGSGS
jgi:hypothetical protein